MGVAAAFTKETAVVLPLWILLMELTIFASGNGTTVSCIWPPSFRR